jgi:outer membrane cobalamin receptor
LEWSGKKLALFTHYAFRDFGDLIAGKGLGKEAPSSYQEQAAGVKARLKTGDHAILTLAYDGVFQSEVGRYDQVAQRGYTLYEFEPQNRQLAYIRGQSGSERAWRHQFEWTASWQYSKEGRHKKREGSDTEQFELDEVRTLGLNVQLQSLISPKLRLLSGIESYWDYIRSSAWEEDSLSIGPTFSRGLYPDGARAGNLATYTSLTADLLPWRFTVGLRYNVFDLRPNDSTFGNARLNPQALVGSFSTHFTWAQHHALIASLSTAFRAPNINDLSSFGSFDFGLEVPTADLEPERSLNVELGYKFKVRNARMQLSVYRMQLYDLISRIRGTYEGQSVWQGEEVYVKANTSRAYIRGLEWDGFWQIHSRWSLQAGMTYTYGQEEANARPMRRIPPFNGSINLRFEPSDNWSFSWQNWYASRQDRLSGGDIADHRIADGGTEGWWVSHLQWAYTRDWFGLNGGLQNLFNEAYRMHGSGIDGVGRSVWFSVSIALEKLVD